MQVFLSEIGHLCAGGATSLWALEVATQAVERQGLYLHGQVVRNPPRLSRVVSPESLPGLLQNVTGRSDFPEDLIRILEDAGQIPLTNACAVPHGRFPIAWVTTSEAVQRVIQGQHPEGRASSLRSYLGLSSRYDGNYLIEVCYPDSFSCPELRVPTVFDGIGEPFFRPVESSSTPDGLGRTVDLRTGDEGLPEAVHQACDLQPGFVVKYVGYTRVTRPQVDLGEYERQSEHLLRRLYS
jgi:hypothetical protein